MKLGVSGHQERDGIDWRWTADALGSLIRRLHDVSAGYSSLAIGTDQLFAEVIINSGIEHVAVVPFSSYRDKFSIGLDRDRYDRLISSSTVLNLDLSFEESEAFLRAGKWIVDEVDHLVAVWDGEPAEGAGGTADVVRYAIQRRVPLSIIDPISLTTS
ncbi:hypothetical protein BZG35_15140 [Brevundimonas sp. LM2]|uniref:hypothetical protein n=1 Tax=Brevundimonas sp. LM2 TaxID=1938605 RepID=UPI0009839907|nr:hypothetical protein [Brevundimonas sp. LM2]AQR62840.1 hypothetical protein BZG35_15140 [Brevundimonas sp. LM2]